MKKAFFHILALTCVALLAAVPRAYSQESSHIPDMAIIDADNESSLTNDKIIYSPGEADTHYVPKTSSSSSSTPKDSGVIKPVVPVVVPVKTKNDVIQKQDQHTKAVPEKHAPKGDDDSILSFNFLYYIIEKYKLQDIID